MPGKMEAENYDGGGQDIAYYDTPPTPAACIARTRSTSRRSATRAVGIWSAGRRRAKWLKYTVNVAAAGTYAIDVRVASNGAGGTFHIEVHGVDKTGPLTVPNTGGWQIGKTVTKTGVALAAGPQVVRVVMDTNGATGSVGNFNWFAIR